MSIEEQIAVQEKEDAKKYVANYRTHHKRVWGLAFAGIFMILLMVYGLVAMKDFGLSGPTIVARIIIILLFGAQGLVWFLAGIA